MVSLTIHDEHSGDQVMEIEFSLKEIGLLITGLHGVKGIATVNTATNIAKKRETERVFCEKVTSYKSNRKDDQRVAVIEDFEEKYEQHGYSLQSDGTTTQQPTDKHEYIIKKYVPVENPLDVERYY